MKAVTARDNTAKDSTVKAGTVKDGTVNFGTVLSTGIATPGGVISQYH